MKLALPLFGYAAAGEGCADVPAARLVPVPEPAGARAGARLPRLALDLAERALDGRPMPETTGVLFGTALGCLGETEVFVAHMLRENEATPKPRLFSSSVHNASASFVALKLGARGECTTFVHGELSFAHALLAAAAGSRRNAAAFLVGAADEAPTLTFAELARAAGRHERGEGGALFVAGGASSFPEAPLAWLEDLAFARPDDPVDWALSELASAPLEPVLYCPAAGTKATARVAANDRLWLTTAVHHPSRLATTSAVALAILSGELQGRAFERECSPERIAVLATSVHGEAALLRLRRR